MRKLAAIQSLFALACILPGLAAVLPCAFLVTGARLAGSGTTWAHA